MIIIWEVCYSIVLILVTLALMLTFGWAIYQI